MTLRDNHGAARGALNGLHDVSIDGVRLGLLGPIWNFEHIFDGVHHQDNLDPLLSDMFEPRREVAPMRIYPQGEASAMMHQPPTPYWGLESAVQFDVADDHVDVLFSAVLRRPSPKGDWLGLFWATYMDAPHQPVFFPGLAPGDSRPRWIKGDSAVHLARNTWIHRDSAADLRFASGYPDKLFTRMAEAEERWAYPFAYGAHSEHAVMFMMDGGPDVRLTQSPLSAWDLQYIIHGWEVGVCYSLRARIVLKRFHSRADVVREYERWSAVDVPGLGSEVSSRQ